MPFPKTLDELIAAGYRFDNRGPCRGCQDEIEWWLTPGGSKMPMNPMRRGSDAAITHWSKCSNASEFRKPLKESKHGA